MDENQLRNFMMICRCASITEAADRLGIAQPSLSQQLLRLEDEFRSKLFHRTSRGVVATDAGRMLLEHASAILQAMNRAREEIHESDREPHGEVSIGLPATASMVLGVPLLVAARPALPQVNLRVREASGEIIRQWLDENRIDLAVLYDAEGVRHLSTKPIARETLLLVGPPGLFGPLDEHGIALEPVDPVVLGNRDFILPSVSHGLRKLIERRLQDHNINISATIEIDSLAHTKTLVRAGMGYTLLSHAAISAELANNELSAARVGNVDFSRSVSLARNPAKALTRASLEIEDLTRKLVREMIADGRWIAEPIDDL
ncbi:MAG: LysR family transcriptional regulator [Sphingomonadales bacterium]|nr:LysR family transcriptional regulator [Sphingomonadales bacterium]MBU3990930.1 LysR family transcriptional regulator [Alphaproteobacteria bacterium]